MNADITDDDLKSAAAGLQTIKRLASQGQQSERVLDVLAGIESGLTDLVEAIASQGDKGALVKAIQSLCDANKTQRPPQVNVEAVKPWSKCRVTAHKNSITGSIESWDIDRIE